MALRRGVPKPSALAVERVVASMCPVAPWWLHRYHWAEEAAHDGADVHAEARPESRGSLERELDALLGSSWDGTTLEWGVAGEETPTASGVPCFSPFDPFAPGLDPMHPFWWETPSDAMDVETCPCVDHSELDEGFYWELAGPWEHPDVYPECGF